MKEPVLIIMLTLINCISSTTKQCYEGFLNFNNEPCPAKDYLEFIMRKSCRDMACAGYAEDLKAHICIHQKPNEFKLIILGDEAQLSFNVPAFSDNDNYTIKQIAISGSHVSLLLISYEAAYRMSFFIKDLRISNDVQLQYLGLQDKLVWQPLIDSDVYMEIDGPSIIKTTQILHDNSTTNITQHYHRCVRFKEFLVAESSTPSMVNPTIVTSQKFVISNGIVISFFALICILFILICGCIACIIYTVRKRKSSRESSSQSSLQSVFPPFPPSYHTNADIEMTLGAIRAEVRNLTNMMNNRGEAQNADPNPRPLNNNTAAVRESVPDERRCLTSHTVQANCGDMNESNKEMDSRKTEKTKSRKSKHSYESLALK